MRIRANMTGEKVEVKVLMAHEMETGLRKDRAKAKSYRRISSVTSTVTPQR